MTRARSSRSTPGRRRRKAPAVQSPAAWPNPASGATAEESGIETVTAASPESAHWPYEFEGHVDFYGQHAQAGGWFIAGWIAYPWPPGHRPDQAAALFADMSVIQCSRTLLFSREEIIGRGIGCLFFFESDSANRGKLLSVFLDSAGTAYTIYPTADIVPLAEQDLSDRLAGLVGGGEYGSQRQKLESLLCGDPARRPLQGTIDFYGYHESAQGWLFCGCMANGALSETPPQRAVVSFDEADIDGEIRAALFPRDDLHDAATGVIFLLKGNNLSAGTLCAVSLHGDGVRATLHAPAATPCLLEVSLLARLHPILRSANPGAQRDFLLSLVARQPYRGEDTIARLAPAVFLEIDEVIRCGSDGLALIGWHLAAPGTVLAVRVRCGPACSTLRLADCVRTDRPDVIDAFGQHGFSDKRCGFIAWLPHGFVPDTRLYIEVETTDGRIAYYHVAPPRLDGLPAIERLLAAADARFSEVRPAFQNVLGPAVERLNAARLANRVAFDVIEYGAVAGAAPRFSVVVPLHQRLDFLEYQLALFSRHPGCADIEFIYVLDDPPKRKEAQFLFESAFRRFRVPFRALLLSENVGYAPANNIGLGLARGRFVAFVNSDVFPGTPDWLERLSGRLADDPGIGAIGPLLLFEDGSVQHGGMYFARVPEFGNWYFGLHHGRGLRPGAKQGPETWLGITGACLLMTRALALELGGFDESYVLGDFEDSDLCLKLQAKGYRCVVDPEVRLFHLERQSQTDSAAGWRMNLTIYNAWLHERRWSSTIAELQGQ